MDYGALIQMVIGMVGEQQAKNMTDTQLRMLAEQVAKVNGIPLPDLAQQKADELGPSNVGAMQSDQSLRAKQLQGLGELQNVIDSGGLDLTDKASIEEALTSAMNQQKRARAGVAADAAERGQMNSGNRLVMDTQAAQAGANTARQNSLDVAGMAQRRRLQAIQDASSMAGGLREEDWREQEAAARAKDLRDERNAGAREKAQYYNAGIPQQNFTNAMARATGSQPAANAYGGALAAGATDARMSAAGMGNIANQAAGAYGGVNSNAGATAPTDSNYQYYTDLTGNNGGPADLHNPDDK